MSTSEPAAGHCARGRAPARRSSGVDRAVGRDLAGHRPGHRSAARARPAHLPPFSPGRTVARSGFRALRDVYSVALLRFLGCTADARDGAARRWRQHRADGGDGPNHDGEHRRGRARTGPIPRSRLPVTRRAALLAWAMTDRVRRERLLTASLRASPPAWVWGGAVGASARLRTLGRSRAARPPRGDRDPAPGASGRRGPGRRPLATTGWDEAARDVLRRRRGRAYDPAVVDAVLTTGLPRASVLVDDVLRAEPEPVRRLDAGGLDRALAALGDFSDLRSRWTVGRSGRVARLAATAAELCGLGADDVADPPGWGAVALGARRWPAAGPTWRRFERLRLHRPSACSAGPGAAATAIGCAPRTADGRPAWIAAAARVARTPTGDVVRPWRGPGAPPRARHP